MSEGCGECVFYVGDEVTGSGFCGIDEASLGTRDWRCTYRESLEDGLGEKGVDDEL